MTHRPPNWIAPMAFGGLLTACSAGAPPEETTMHAPTSSIGDTGHDGTTAAEDTTDVGDADELFDLGGPGATSGGAEEEECNAVVVDSTLRTLPVDVILVVDTSSSMEEHTNAIEASINVDFADTMEASELDYKVVVLAKHGSGAALCVGQPLSGTDCDPPPMAPAPTGRFHHYDADIGSAALLDDILAWYTAPEPNGAAPGGWSDWVRPDAHKVFVAFSDTEGTSNDPGLGTTWDESLRMLDPASFGTQRDRRYIFHSIIGIVSKGGAGSAEPWLPEDGLQLGGECGSDDEQGPGGSIQQVSILSGGWRFPVCSPSSFDLIFQQVALAIVEGTPVSCDIEIPAPPPGETIDADTFEVEYTGEGGTTVTFAQVPTLEACGAEQFYVSDGFIHLCPAGCDTVTADHRAQLRLSYGCDVGYDPVG